MNILLGLFIGRKLLDFLGLLQAIPLTCLGLADYRRYVLHHYGSQCRRQFAARLPTLDKRGHGKD